MGLIYRRGIDRGGDRARAVACCPRHQGGFFVPSSTSFPTSYHPSHLSTAYGSNGASHASMASVAVFGAAEPMEVIVRGAKIWTPILNSCRQA